MPITAKENSKPRELIPQGVHDAICYLVVDIGTQVTNFGDKRKIIIGWEFSDIRMKMEDGTDMPKVKSTTLTLSLHEKSALRPLLEGWRNRKFTAQELSEGFDISRLLGVNCQIQILHETKDSGVTYDNIANVIPPKSGQIAKVQTENDHVYFSLEDGNAIPEGVYDWIKDKIKSSVEWGTDKEPEYITDGPDVDEDDCPF